MRWPATPRSWSASDLLLRYPDDETLYLGLLLIDRRRQAQGIGTAAYQALEREVLPRWP